MTETSAWIAREVWDRAVDATEPAEYSRSSIFDGFPLEGMVGIDRDWEPREDDWLTATPADYVERTRWFALLRRPGHIGEERVEIPRPVVTELQRTNGGTCFRVHYDEPDPGARLAAEINAVAERVAQRYLDTPQRFVLGPDSELDAYAEALRRREADMRSRELIRALYGPHYEHESPDTATPDTSQPYFLDLIGRIDAITEEQQ